MAPEFIKERIKTETEIARMYFIVFLTDISGTTAFYTSDNFSGTGKQSIIIVIGVVIAITLISLIINTLTKIKNLTSHLS